MFRPERNKIICICWLYKKKSWISIYDIRNDIDDFKISTTKIRIINFRPCTTYMSYIIYESKIPQHITHVRHIFILHIVSLKKYVSLPKIYFKKRYYKCFWRHFSLLLKCMQFKWTGVIIIDIWPTGIDMILKLNEYKLWTFVMTTCLIRSLKT